MATMKVANLGLLVRCYEGLRNWRALVLLVAGFVLAALLVALDFTVSAHLMYESPTIAQVLRLLLAVVALLVLLGGINGAGLLLVDQADAKPARSFSAAFFGGLGVTLQSIVCLLALALGLLLVVLVLWALSYLSKIPGVGPVFAFLLAGPTMLILAFCYALLVFGITLMFVALWRGHGMIGAIGRAIDIVIKRPLDVVLHFIVLWLLIVPIELLVFWVLFLGAIVTGLMYLSGGGAYGYGGVMGMLSSGGAGFAGAALSIVVVVAAIWAGFGLIAMLGNILIFDSLAPGTSATSAGFLEAKVRQLKAKVEEHRPSVAPQASPAAAKCAQCGATLAASDKFCGECGAPQ